MGSCGPIIDARNNKNHENSRNKNNTATKQKTEKNNDSSAVVVGSVCGVCACGEWCRGSSGRDEGHSGRMVPIGQRPRVCKVHTCQQALHLPCRARSCKCVRWSHAPDVGGILSIRSGATPGLCFPPTVLRAVNVSTSVSADQTCTGPHYGQHGALSRRRTD